MVTRWMRLDRERVHSLVLLAQEVPVPTSLRQAVESSGGQIYRADPASSAVQQAAWLRQLAVEEANFVILHLSCDDVTCGVAFGIAGGPPVMLINHEAHVYWNGASTTDQVVNCRGSELEVFWSATYRGVGSERCTIVPIPLEVPPSREGKGTATVDGKIRARQALGIASDAVVILTVGSRFKYLPIAGLDFTEVWKEILEAVPTAVLLAIGFHGDQRWKDASAQVGNRMRTLGAMPHSQLLEVMDAADLYVEAFPFGTTTSLLEAGLKGLPVALAPAQSPPPYATDGIALDDVLQRPSTIREYQATIRDFCLSVDKRVALGSKVRDSIMRHHCGAGWKAHLESAVKSLPRTHGILTALAPIRTPPAIHEIWSLFVPQWSRDYQDILEVTVKRAFSVGLRPHSTPAMRKACKDHRALRRGHCIPLPVLVVLLDAVLPFLPIRWSTRTIRLCAFLSRGSLVSRTWERIVRPIGRSKVPVGPYHEYRQMREAPNLPSNTAQASEP